MLLKTAMPRTAPTLKTYLCPNVDSAEVEKPWTGGTWGPLGPTPHFTDEIWESKRLMRFRERLRV